MRAWLIDSLGGIGQLHLGNLPDPTPAAGEVVLAVRYAGLNPADRYLAEGAYPARPPMPFVLGRDAVGEVVAVGSGVSGVKVGDVRGLLRGETGVTRNGTFAERVAVAADMLIDIPAGWTEPQTAGAPLVYLTAWQAITQWEPPPRGSVVLVTGASGGVGLAVVQMASALGLRVVALTRSVDKAAILRTQGADLTLDPADTQWRKTLADTFGPKPVAIAVDNIAGAGFADVVDVMGQNGRISVVGRLAGPVPAFNTSTLFFRRLRIGGVAVGTFSPAEARAAWQSVLTTLGAAHRAPMIDRTFEFTELPAAFARLAEGPMGKVLIRVP